MYVMWPSNWEWMRQVFKTNSEGATTENPALIILVGAPGTGKSVVAHELGQLLSVPALESESLVERRLGGALSDLMVDDPEGALEALNVAALDLLQGNFHSEGGVITLSSSAPLNPKVAAALQDVTDKGGAVVVLTASLATLVKRNGLNAPQPPGLGTPRAWFRSHLRLLEEAYLLIGDYWCDTDRCDPRQCAEQIVKNLGPPTQGGQED